MKPSPAPWSWGMSGEQGQVLVAGDGRRLLSVPPGAIYNTRPGDDELIAMAPEMRDMVLALEWAGGDFDALCPMCGEKQETAKRRRNAHDRGCQLGDLLARLR